MHPTSLHPTSHLFTYYFFLLTSFATFDHLCRFLLPPPVSELVDGLRKAVESIPSYIERCTQMWVLVPACEHEDASGTICDFWSWRSRGWCRST